MLVSMRFHPYSESGQVGSMHSNHSWKLSWQPLISQDSLECLSCSIGLEILWLKGCVMLLLLWHVGLKEGSRRVVMCCAVQCRSIFLPAWPHTPSLAHRSDGFQISSPRRPLEFLQLLHLQHYDASREKRKKKGSIPCRQISSTAIILSNLRCHSNIDNFRVLDQNCFKVSWSYLIFRVTICYNQ